MKKSIILSLFLLFTLGLSAQTDKAAKTWHVQTTDENEYYGSIVREDSVNLTLKTTTIGEITIRKSIIKKMEEVNKDQLFEGGFSIPNAHSSRYFWSPNGFGLKRGEGYYQNTWVFLNQVSVGVTDHFTMGVGVVPLFLFGSDIGGTTPFWITPKLQFPINEGKNNVGLGVIYMNVIGKSSGFGGAGIAYGVTTFGDRNKNITVGLGYGFAEGNWAKLPTVTLSGMYRLNKSNYLMTENWFISAGEERILIILVGGRYTARVLSFDYGLGRPVFLKSSFNENSFFWAFPWLGINVPFGNKVR